MPQPADELDAALGEALEPADNERNDAAGGGGGFSQEFEAFGAAFEFRGVLDAGVGEGLIVQNGEVVSEAEKGGLGGFGGGGAGPGFLFIKFVFEGVVDFFDVPSAAVKEDDEAGGEGHLIGEELPGFPGGGVRPGDAAQDAAGIAAQRR